MFAKTAHFFLLPISLCTWLCSKCHQDVESVSPPLNLNWIYDFLWAVKHSRGDAVQFWVLVSRGMCVSAHLIGFLPCHENTSGLTCWRMRDHKRGVGPAVTKPQTQDIFLPRSAKSALVKLQLSTGAWVSLAERPEASTPRRSAQMTWILLAF